MRRDGPFKLLTSFNVAVPEGVHHTDLLDTFREEQHRKFFHYDASLTDGELGSTLQTLNPGEKFLVFELEAKRNVTEEECIEYLNAKNATFLGAHGLCLVYAREGWRFFRNKRVASYGFNMAAYISSSPKGHTQFIVCGIDDMDLGKGDILLCFCVND